MDACSIQTRGTTKLAQASGDQEESTPAKNLVAQVYERDPKNYGKAMRSEKAGINPCLRILKCSKTTECPAENEARTPRKRTSHQMGLQDED